MRTDFSVFSVDQLVAVVVVSKQRVQHYIAEVRTRRLALVAAEHAGVKARSFPEVCSAFYAEQTAQAAGAYHQAVKDKVNAERFWRAARWALNHKEIPNEIP